MNHQLLLTTAINAAREAEKVIRHYYQHPIQVEIKTDDSPVTRADREAEKAIYLILSHAFPDFGFYGEETGQSQMQSPYLWLVDPLDGTKSFIRGYPFISTQIALMKEGELILGVSNAPFFNELACAVKGMGAWLNDKPLAVSQFSQFSQSTLSTGNLKTLAQNREHWQKLGELVPQFTRVRGYGDFYHYHLLAAGKIDAVIESDVNILDIAALSVIVEQAGGKVTELDGRPINLNSTTILATNNLLHAPLLNQFNGSGRPQ